MGLTVIVTLGLWNNKLRAGLRGSVRDFQAESESSPTRVIQERDITEKCRMLGMGVEANCQFRTQAG